MAIVRTYECGDCGTRFDKLHFDRSEPPPECPGCAALAARQVPAGFAIGGSNVSKAVDTTYAEMERMGFSDMKDNLRQGDLAIPNHKPEVQKAIDGYWGGAPSMSLPGGNILAAGKAATAMAKAQGAVNPLEIAHKARKERNLTRVPVNPVVRVKGMDG